MMLFSIIKQDSNKLIKKILINALLLFCFLFLKPYSLCPAIPPVNDNLQKFKITAIAEKRNIPLNREFKVTITVIYAGEPGDYIITDPYVEKFHNLELVGNSTESLVKTPTNKNSLKEVIKNYIYILKPESLGQAYFPIVRITVSDNKGNLINELATQPISITIEEPVIKRDYSSLFTIIIIILVILTIGFFLTQYILKRKKKKEEEKRLEEERLKNIKTPEQEFSEEFKKIRELKDIEKLSSATSLLKIYFRKKFNYNFKDKSTNEIIKYFQKNKIIKPEIIDDLQEILKESDLIKFAAEKPDTQKIETLTNKLKNTVDLIKKIDFTGGSKNEQGD